MAEKVWTIQQFRGKPPIPGWLQPNDQGGWDDEHLRFCRIIRAHWMGFQSFREQHVASMLSNIKFVGKHSWMNPVMFLEKSFQVSLIPQVRVRG